MGGSSDFGGGYPVILFVQNDFNKFLCSICCKILREPMQSFCGHRFCKGCIAEVLGSGLMIKCPQCKLEGIAEEEYSVLKADQMYPDNAVKREMSCIKVRCVNPGCSWQGYFREYEDHASQCPYQMARCPQCGNFLPQLELGEHMTKTCPKMPVNCKHCGELITNAEIPEHSRVCPKHPLRCELCKTKKIPRDKLKDHQDNECPNRKWTWPQDGEMDHVSQCSYQMAQCPQCGNSIPQLGLVEHITKACPKMSVNCKHCGNQITNVELSLQDHQDNECPNRKWTCHVDDQMVEGNRFERHMEESAGNRLVFVMEQLQNTADKINQLEQILGNMASCPLTDSGSQEQHVRSGEMQMRVRQQEVKTDTFEGIVRTLSLDIEQCITMLDRVDRQTQLDKKNIESQECKIQSLERMLAVRNLRIMDLDARIQSFEYASYDGILLWRIYEFSKHKLEAQRGKTLSIYSPAFYTSRTGYKMCIRMYPNGDGMGKGSHMSLFFVIMRGPYDALLSWPFMQRVTFILMDQNNREHVINSFRPNPASSSFKRPTSDMNIASGCPLFIPHKRLDDPTYGYIKEDTMYIKTVVDATNLPVLNDNKKPADVSNTLKHSV